MALPDPQQPGETYGNVSPTDDWFSQQAPPTTSTPQQGAPESGPPPGMSPEAWAEAEAYLDHINPSRRQRPERGDFETWDAYQARLSEWQRRQGAQLPPRNPADIDAAARTGGYTPPGGATNLPGGDQRAAVEAFIANWQRTHDPHEGIAGLTQALAQQFPGTVTPYMYGSTPSNNEISLGGEKYKVLGGEGGAAAYWYIPGTDDSGGGDGGGWGRLGGGTGSLAGIAAEALTTSPGYQFRLQEGTKALERSAASKGTLLTGGTLKGLTRYAQDFASNEYGNNYARLFGEQGQRYNQLYGLSQLGLNAAGQQATLNSSYATNAGNAAQTYATNVGTLNTNQANTNSDLTTQGGNAQAGGVVGKANASTAAIQAAVNAGNTALVLWLMQQQKNASVPGA